jgi:hypothetical protein
LSIQADTSAGTGGRALATGPSAPGGAGLAPSVAELRRLPATVLKDEGDGAARVLRIDLPGGPVVLKEWHPRGLLLRIWARQLMRREIRNYRRLSGMRGIPQYLGHEGDHALVLQFVDGLPIRRQLDPARLRLGLDSLDQVLAGLHARHFAHLDLHQKLNTLVDARGEAWLIDLGQGLHFGSGARALVSPLLFPLLARIDRNAVLKFRARYAPDTLPDAERERLVARFGGRSRWWPKLIGRRLRRLLAGGR